MATTINRDNGAVELVNPPIFEYGQKVRSRKYVRNDGTFPGKDIGDVIVGKGDVGYVTSIGTFLQQFYIYGIDFYELGYRVGMRGKELELIEEDDDEGEGDDTLSASAESNETLP